MNYNTPYFPYYPDFVPDPRVMGGVSRGWYPFDPRDIPDPAIGRGIGTSIAPRTRAGGCSDGGFDFRGPANTRALTPDDFSNAVTGNGTTGIANGSLEPMVAEELRRCASGLRGLETSLNNRESADHAKVAAVSYFFYALGLLLPKGVTIPRDIQPRGVSTAATTRGGACKEFGDSIEKFIDKYTRGVGADIGDIVDKGKDCWDHLTK